MSLAVFVVSAFGLFSLMGGAVGYFKAKSLASLIAGVVSGILLLSSAYGMTQNVRAAFLTGLVVALLLGVRFLKTWLKNRRIMPDLLMVVFSSATIIVTILELFKA